MDTTKCISDKDWERYSRNQLAAEEKAQLEFHVASCEICADIKEGIDSMKSPSNLESINKQLHQKIGDRVRPEPKRTIPIVYWLSAAAVLIVATFGMLRLSEKSDQQQVQIIPLVQPDTSHKLDDNKTIVLADKPKQQPKARIKKSKANTKPEVIQPTVVLPTQVQSDESVKEEAEAVQSKALVAPMAEQRQESEKNDGSPEVDDSKNMKIESTSAKSPERKKKLGSRTLSLPSNKAYNNNQVYESDNYANNSIHSFSSQVSDSLLVLNVTQCLERGAYDSALVQVKPLLVNTSGKWYEEARWLQALGYYGKGEKKIAKALMERIAKGNGKRQNDAIILLKEWED